MPIDLDAVTVAKPCSVKWRSMTGSDPRVRFCGKCEQYVYNLATLSRDEAVGLIQVNEGRVCARLFRRLDGTVVTKECAGVGASFCEAFEHLSERIGVAVSVALVLAAFFALGVWCFGDTVRALFGMTTSGALAGDVAVEKRVTRPPQHLGPEHHDKMTY